MSKAQELLLLRKECLNCRKCSIGGQNINGHLSNVFSNMCIKSGGRIVVVGQNPGEREVELKKPFVGPSGRFFDNAIKEILGIDRSSLYVSNCVRCYTPNNRAPTDKELENCRFVLDKEIEILKPELIVVLGNFSLRQITGATGITKQHGKITSSLRYGVKVLPFYHPSPLNTNRPEIREAFKKDLLLLKDYI